MKKRLIDAIDIWLNDYKRLSVKPATYDRLLVARGTLMKSRIAQNFVEDLCTDDIQHYLNDLVELGYSRSTIKKQYTLLTAYLKYAMSRGELSHPIYLGTKLPRTEDDTKSSVRVFTEDEQLRLERVLYSLENPIYAVAVLMLESGMRVGEALALTWDDISWRQRSISVNKTWVRIVSERREFVQQSTKSNSSNRVIPMSRRAADVLRRMYDASNKIGYIFDASYSAVRYHLAEACRKAGVSYKGTHAFRHTFATNCYHRGCDVKLLSKLLGHADVAITYNIYIHLFGDALEEMRKVVE